jgi:hypothetical protein
LPDQSAAHAPGWTRTPVESLNPVPNRAENPTARRLSRGEPRDTEVNVKARLYKAALALSVVAVFLEGLSAGWKW